jgi:cobalamin biosynthesis protein CobT
MKTLKGWEFRKGIEDAAHKVASTLKIKVTISWEKIPTACVDSRGNITLCDVRDDAVIKQATYVRYVGFLIHEMLHKKYTSFGIEFSNDYVRQLTNGLEDARIEHLGIAAELTGNIAKVLGDLADAIATESLDKVSDWSDPRQFPFVLAIFCRNHGTVEVPVAPQIKALFAETRTRLNKCTNTPQVAELAQWVYDQLVKLSEDEPKDTPKDLPEPKGGEGDASGEGDGEGDGEGSADGDGEGDADGEDGEGDGDGKAKPISRPDPSDVVCPEPTAEAEKGTGGGVSWSPSASIKRDCLHTENMTKWDLNPVGGAKLRYEVKRLFENSGIDEFQFNRRAGQLNTRALHTVAVGNDRVFKRHHEEGGIDSAVVLIMDCSGSMFDERMSRAAPVMATLLDTLDRAGVATSIITFGTHVSMLKSFDMTKAKAMPLLAGLKSGADNSDSQALRYAHTLLLNRPEQRKVTFILGDGGVDRNDEKRCMEQSNAGENLGITTIGIGIVGDLSRMYKNNIYIRDLSDLANASFKQIKLAA